MSNLDQRGTDSGSRRLSLALLAVGALGLLVALVLLAAIVVLKYRPVGRPSLAPTSTLLVQVQNLKEFVTVKYLVEKVVKLESEPILLGRDKIILLVHAVVKAGVDLSQMKPEDFQVDGTKVTLRLPAGRVLDYYIDEKKTEVWQRDKAFWRPFDKDLEQNARLQALEQIRLAAGERGIQKEAVAQAQRQITMLLTTLGFTEVKFVP